MKSFFTLPTSSQRKRKRTQNIGLSPKRSRISTDVTSLTSGPRNNDSISGSDSEPDRGDADLAEVSINSNSSGDEGGTGAERRLKLAERYLENITDKAQEQIGFDAEDVDKDLIAERLKEGVAETRGKICRFIASDYDYANASRTTFRNAPAGGTNSIAICTPYAYTVTSCMHLTKWELPTLTSRLLREKRPQTTQKPTRRRPQKLGTIRGVQNPDSGRTFQGHTAPILCVAASSDGKFVVTGGEEGRVVVWSSELKPLRVFTQHRDAVTSLTFRRGTNQLYSASADRTIKIWSLDELAYVETLFGHQDEVVDCAALSQERCLSVGSRDRSARLWKIVDETQLVFRGSAQQKKRKDVKDDDPPSEGSLDRVAFLSDETFVTGSDNGSLCLWSVYKKKPVFIFPVAHGRDPALPLQAVFAEKDMNGREAPAKPEARWITALKAIPYSDLIISASWDGFLRVWKVQDQKFLEPVALVRVGRDLPSLTREGEDYVELSESNEKSCSGVINDLDIVEMGERGKDGLCIVVASSKHHRLGRWKKIERGQNGAAVIEIPRKHIL